MAKTYLAAKTSAQADTSFVPDKRTVSQEFNPKEVIEKMGIPVVEMPEDYPLYEKKVGGKSKTVYLGDTEAHAALITLDESGKIRNRFQGQGLDRVVFLKLHEIRKLHAIFSGQKSRQ